MHTSTDPYDGAWIEDIPLPGMDFGSRTQPSARRSRPYDPSLPPTGAAISAFWSRVVKAPGDGCWIWTGAISDGYGRYRAKLHLVDYSTSL